MKRALPVSLLSWCALLVVAAFLPWGTYSATPDFSVNGIHIPDQMLPFPIEPVSYTHLDVYKRQVQLTAVALGFEEAQEVHGVLRVSRSRAAR